MIHSYAPLAPSVPTSVPTLRRPALALTRALLRWARLSGRGPPRHHTEEGELAAVQLGGKGKPIRVPAGELQAFVYGEPQDAP